MRYDLGRLAETDSSSRAPALLSEQTTKVLSTLSPLEEMILRMHFGIARTADTLKGLSRQISLPTKRVRQIEMQALRKVRERARSLFQPDRPAMRTTQGLDSY